MQPDSFSGFAIKCLVELLDWSFLIGPIREILSFSIDGQRDLDFFFKTEIYGLEPIGRQIMNGISKSKAYQGSLPGMQV